MPARRQTKQRVREARTEAYRSLILEAAERVFAARGYAEARVQAIALQAGGATGPSLVLLVSPETAEQLAHAAAFGQITVTIAPLDAV